MKSVSNSCHFFSRASPHHVAAGEVAVHADDDAVLGHLDQVGGPY